MSVLNVNDEIFRGRVGLCFCTLRTHLLDYIHLFSAVISCSRRANTQKHYLFKKKSYKSNSCVCFQDKTPRNWENFKLTFSPSSQKKSKNIQTARSCRTGNTNCSKSSRVFEFGTCSSSLVSPLAYSLHKFSSPPNFRERIPYNRKRERERGSKDRCHADC